MLLLHPCLVVSRVLGTAVQKQLCSGQKSVPQLLGELRLDPAAALGKNHDYNRYHHCCPDPGSSGPVAQAELD